MLTTMGLALFLDPLMAVIFGVIAANAINADRLEQLELDSVISVPLLDSVFLRTEDEADPFRGARRPIGVSRRFYGRVIPEARTHDRR